MVFATRLTPGSGYSKKEVVTVPDVERPEAAIEKRINVASGQRERFDNWWFLFLGVVVAVVLLVTLKPDPFRRIVLFLRDGIWVTVRITGISFVLILVVGLVGGLGRLSKNWLIQWISSLYVEIIRGVPLLVQLLFLYFAFPQVLDSLGAALIKISPSLQGVGDWFINVKPDPFAMAVVGLTICYGAYMSEIYRAGIQSISRGQMEAARSLGMNYFQAMRHVVLPQAVRVILPPVGNEFVALLKDSSLVSVVAVSDMTRRGREFMSASFMSLETWSMVALLYLVMTLFASRVVAYIERKTAFAK
jgi:polar amino acid transport system permease protein